MKTKICSLCKISYSITHFWRRSNSNLLLSWCKWCCRLDTYKRKFNVTKEELTKILIDQDYKCAICLEELDLGKNTCLDHDHTKNEIRGFLCRICNCGLGYLNDSTENIGKAINYLVET